MFNFFRYRFVSFVIFSYRFIAFGIMIITVIIAYAMNGPYEPNTLDSDWSSSFSSSFSQQQDSTFWGFKFSGFTVMFTSTAFALTVHYNLPNSLSPVRDKTHLKRVVLLVILVAVCFYWLVGAICAMFFREYLCTFYFHLVLLAFRSLSLSFIFMFFSFFPSFFYSSFFRYFFRLFK